MKSTVKDVLKILNDLKTTVEDNQLQIVNRGCPHHPNNLEKGKMAIYCFKYQGRFLKIGKVGPRSNARFKSQHYNPNSSRSNLAKSILNDKDMTEYKLSDENIGNWIRENIERIDILLDEKLGVFVLNLIEEYLHCKYLPKYEGFENQR